MNNSKPLVTIVTITFNLIKAGREDYFRQCVESVNNQTYPNIEHIIIDGASTDGTIDLLEEYAKKGWISYKSEPDKGLYNAMNKGIDAAKGKYLAFLNSDDFYSNKKAIELSVSALEEEKADFSFANYLVIGKGQRYVEKGDLERFIYIMPFGHPTMFAKTAVLKAENGFDETLGLPADYDLVIRLILNGYLSTYVNSEIVTYRLGGVGTTTDHSDEIGRVYLKNYSSFYHFSSIGEAKKIMYEGILPRSFPAKFAKFAKRNKLKNIDMNKVMSYLESLAPKKRSEVFVESLRLFLKRHPRLYKLWKIIR
jgi:glycosyltransferase involved in cell wall biosynthesis